MLRERKENIAYTITSVCVLCSFRFLFYAYRSGVLCWCYILSASMFDMLCVLRCNYLFCIWNNQIKLCGTKTKTKALAWFWMILSITLLRHLINQIWSAGTCANVDEHFRIMIENHWSKLPQGKHFGQVNHFILHSLNLLRAIDSKAISDS